MSENFSLDSSVPPDYIYKGRGNSVFNVFFQNY